MKKNHTGVTASKIWQMLEKELADAYINKIKKDAKIKSLEVQNSERLSVKKRF